VLLDGARPVDAAADTLAAVADLRAGTLVDVSGKRNVTMKSDAILRADDGERYDADGGHPPHCR
jgi:hypothetical protein